MAAKRKTKTTPAKRSAAAKKAARSRKAVKAMKPDKAWHQKYNQARAAAAAAPEPKTVYDWAVANGRRQP